MSVAFNNLKKNILNNVKERSKIGIPPLPLNIEEVTDLCSIIRKKNYLYTDNNFIKEQFINRIIPGVDETSYVKANLLNDICNCANDYNLTNLW